MCFAYRLSRPAFDHFRVRNPELLDQAKLFRLGEQWFGEGFLFRLLERTYEFRSNRDRQYFHAPKTFTYYNTSSATATELIKATLQYFDSTVDFSKFDNNHAGHIDGMNIFYAGNAPQFRRPLWPHSGSYGGTEKYDGIPYTNYEMTDIGTQLGLYVFCHENGHMLFGFPDCYGCGDMVGLMGSRPNDHNPIPDCEVFTQDQGWIDVVDFDNTSTGTFKAIKNPFYAFRYKNPNKANEYYLWVNRKNEGRWSVLTGKGIVAYHFDASVRTSNAPGASALFAGNGGRREKPP